MTGLEPDVIRRLAHDLAAAPSACVYGRIGTTTALFGTLSSWLVDVLNALTGNLDRPGGAMFTKAAAGASNTRGTPRHGRGTTLHRRRSRVRGIGETLGELPVAVLAEEIDTPGEGQVRALVTVAGNPVLSTPNAGRLDAALATLDLYVAVDPYVNETTRHADVILPPPTPCRRATTTWRCCSSPCATSPTTARRCCPSTTTSSTSGRSWPASRCSPRAWAPTPTRRSSTTSSSAPSSARRSATRPGRSPGATPTRSWPCWASAPDPSA